MRSLRPLDRKHVICYISVATKGTFTLAAGITTAMARKAKDMIAFNELAIKAAKPGWNAEKGIHVVKEHRIEGVDRLTLRVEVSGTGSFWLRYSSGGTVRRIRVGDRETDKLRDVKTRALALNAKIEAGEDPHAIETAARGETTIGQLWDAWLAEYTDAGSKKRKSDRTVEYYQQALDQFVFPEFGKNKLADTVSVDAAAALIRKTIKATSRHRGHAVRCALGTMYRFGYSQRLVRSNPVLGLQFTHQSAPRDREPDADELRGVWRAIESGAVTTQMGRVLKLLILTGARNSMVSGARHDELRTLATANPIWKIKGSRTKNKKEHSIPLGPVATEMFREAVADSTKYNSTDGTLVFGLAVESVSKAMKIVCDKAGIADLRNHDMRRAITRWGERNGVSYDVRKRILAHSFQDVTTRSYGGDEMLDPMRDALVRWEQYVVRCVSGDDEKAGQDEGNVVRLAKAKCA